MSVAFSDWARFRAKVDLPVPADPVMATFNGVNEFSDIFSLEVLEQLSQALT